MSEVQKDPPSRKPLNAPVIWLERDDLRMRVQQRISVMVKHGYWEECERLVQEGWSRDAKPLISFSYRYMLAALHDEMSRDEALEKTFFGTWKLVRKQRTWGNGFPWPKLQPDQIQPWLKENPPFS